MNSNNYFLLGLALLFLGPFHSFSQSDEREQREAPSILLDRWEVRGGFSFGLDFPVHEQFKELRQLEKDPLLPNHQFSYRIQPSFVHSIGVTVGRKQFERVTVGSGLRFAKKGYRLVVKTTFQDPEYQFDENTIEKARLRVWALELPTWTAYQLSEGWRVELGTLFGLNLQSTAKVVSRSRSEVFINGELDEDRSYAGEKVKTKLTDGISSLSFGWYCSIHRRIDSSVEWTATFARTGGYVEQRSEDIAGCRVTTGLQFQF